MKRKAKMFDCNEAAGGFWLQTPFDQGFVDDLKGEIPKYARQWDSFRKMWWIDQDYSTEALLLAQRYYRIDAPPQLRSNGRTGGSAHDMLFLTPNAPLCVVRAAYRALAVLHHPDHGGNVRVMQALNLAFEELNNE